VVGTDASLAEQIVAARRAVLDASLTPGVDVTRALSDATDRGLIDVFEAVVDPGAAGHVALAALGGYGRRQLAPGSDLDVVLLHDGRCASLDEVAAALWYPLWDAGLRLGHGVRTTGEQLKLAGTDLHSATALLSARHLAGVVELTDRLAAEAQRRWRAKSDRHLAALAAEDKARRSRCGEVAYLLEPDVKDGIGGLRDAQSLQWARAAGMRMLSVDVNAVDAAAQVLTTVRVGLHRVTGRHGDVLQLEYQDDVAATVGYGDADELMAAVSAAGRAIGWIYEQSWGGYARSRVKRHPRAQIAPGVEFAHGSMELLGAASPADDPTLVLSVAIAAARYEVPIGRTTLERLVEELPPWEQCYGPHWPAGALDELLALLLEGHRAIPVLETLDQVGLLARILPEWQAVRAKPQRNVYHRFTVDRHLWETAAKAADLVDRVGRPDLLVLGALFHDIGKGFAGDHTEIGVELFPAIGARMGLPADDVDVVTNLVRHHLLLPTVALTRDLADPATIASVAEQVRTTDELDLLHALTVADSLATGPTAWSTWKEELIDELVVRSRQVLGGAGDGASTWQLFPDADTLAAMAADRQQVRVTGNTVTVVAPDAPGVFARVAGALTLCGLDVLTARAASERGSAGAGRMAASQFRVLSPSPVDVDTVATTVTRALAGELAIEARVADRARSVRGRRRQQAEPPSEPSISFLDGASRDSTVIEVRAPTRIGLLHALARALGDVGLDIRHATVQTIGLDVLDTFYVRNTAGELVTDDFHRGEIRRALLHALAP
jgi:[protein-PII] uridylyltransferase